MNRVAAIVGLASCLAAADGPWDDVKAILDARCVECHGPAKTKSGLRLDTPAGIRLGGSNGVVLSAGDPGASSLYGRTVLPDDSDDLMPPKGGRLTPAQTEAIRAWIAAGAPMPGGAGIAAPTSAAAGQQTAVAAAAAPWRAPPNELDALAATLPDPDALAVARLQEEGFLITALEGTGRVLEVVASHLRKPCDDAAVARLAPLAAHIVWLDLSGSAVTDAGMSPVAGCRNLRRLRLDRTMVGDAGMEAIGRIAGLESLNLVATQVGDQGLVRLAALQRLRSLHLWKAKTTADASGRLARAIPGLDITRGE